MADATQLFKDDEQDRLGNGYIPDDEGLRKVTGVGKDEENGYDNNARSGAAEDIANREKGAVDKGDSKTSGASGLAAAEALGGGLSALNPALGAIKGGKILSVFWGNKKRKRNTIGGGIAGAIVAIVMFFMGIASGPFQLIHLAQILGKAFTHSEDATSRRTSGLFRYAKTGELGHTRVGYLGSKIFGSSIDQLKSIGVEFETTKTSNIKSATIDIKKLSEKYPELKKMSNPQKIGFIADKLGVPATDLGKISGDKTSINTRNYSVKATRLLLKNSTALLENGKIVSSIKVRTLAKFFNTPSMFHPMRKLDAAAEKKLSTLVGRKEAERTRQTNIEEPVREKITPLKDALHNKLSGGKAKLGSALLITGMACTIKDSAGEIVAFNNAAVLAPSIVKASGAIALGSQIQSGQDITSSQVGAAVESLQDSEGKSIWGGEALQVMASNSQTGTDLPGDYKQLYSSSTTANGIVSTFNTGVINTLCSPVGVIAQAIAGVGLLAASLPSYGGSAAVLVASKAIVSTAASILIVKSIVSLVETNNVIPEVLSGPLGGNILAYGARAAAGVEARSAGGVELTAAQSALLDKQSQLEEQKNFNSMSLFAKVFNAKDYRSLSGKLIDSIKPSFQQNVASMLGSFTNLGSLVTSIFSSMLPKASAATEPYDWGFPEYGIPPEVLSNAAYDDPYDNAEKVDSILNSAGVDDVGNSRSSYAVKASACFGVTIQKNNSGWDVSYDNAVYSSDKTYTDENCNNTSDSNWVRMMLFVFDTKTMKAAACYDGDTQSCQDLGQAN